jgi:hypothetical protein
LRRRVRYEFEEVGFRFCESVIGEDPRASLKKELTKKD